ncbi:MAG: methylamine utilization protein [Acidobacteria bacterium]|nr:methylamine utilization protein [Acidobacteriota bacterium]
MRRPGLPLLLLGLLASPAMGADLAGNVQASGKPVQDAIVWLDAPTAPPSVQSSPVVLDQRNLAFSPPVLAVRVGTSVDFPNNDRVFHNVFSFHDGKKFDLGMYPAGVRAKTVVFNKPGLSRIFCNIHPHMAAYVMSVDTPYFAVADERGLFTMSAVPPGTYTYHAWRSGGQTLSGTVTVGPTRPLEILWP